MHYIRIYIHTYIHIYIYIYKVFHTYNYTYICLHAYTYTLTYKFKHACTHTHTVCVTHIHERARTRSCHTKHTYTLINLHYRPNSNGKYACILAMPSKYLDGIDTGRPVCLLMLHYQIKDWLYLRKIKGHD